MKPTAKMPEEWRLRPQERNGWPKTLTAAELLDLELPPIRWSVTGLLPEGVTLLAGKPKLGKSWMALGIAIAISTGGVALGTRPVEMGEVLYMALEDNHRRLRKRLEKLLTGETPERLHIATEWPRMDEGGAEALERWLEAHPDARLVVVDILKRVRPRTSPNRSVYEADYEALEAMQRLAAEYEVSILVVHHLRKLGAADPLDEISGSTGLSGGADGVLVLQARSAGVVSLYGVVVILSGWVRVGCARLLYGHEVPPRGPGSGVRHHLRGHSFIRRHHYTRICTRNLPLIKDLWYNSVSTRRLRRS